MVGIQPQGPFCDAGAPVVDVEGALVAIGAGRDSMDGGFLTRLIDVRAVRAVLEAGKATARGGRTTGP